jgi:hypothetical protein
MQHSYKALHGLRPLDLVSIGRCFRKRLPESERAHYDAYLSHVGRNDFVSASTFSESRIDPQLWFDVEPAVLKVIRQAYSLTEKISVSGDQKAEDSAWKKFLQMERKCKMTNRKIRYLRLRPDRIRKVSGGVMTLQKLQGIRDTIAKLLGPFESQYIRILSRLSYGPGMTLSSRDPSRVSLPYKLIDRHTITSDCKSVLVDYLKVNRNEIPYYCEFVRGDLGHFVGRLRTQEIPGCRITFVDKTSVIKRTIAIEPSVNVSFQLAVHRVLVARLKRFGIDLKDQTRNRSLAFNGSRDGSIGTIDLSSASDTISIELVRWLLPPDWFALLDCLRSKAGHYRGNTVAFEKFSSMGNGFTFVLETILFYAIAYHCCDNGDKTLCSVYGDDIIVPVPSFNSVLNGLRFFGFLPNRKKSFGTGPFRESCGLDAFKGVDIRPVYIRSVKPTFVERLAIHNHFYRRGLFDVCKIISDTIPEHFRVFGPPGPSDGYLFTEDSIVLRNFRRWNRETQGYVYRGYALHSRRSRLPSRYLLEASLFDGGAYSSGATLRFRTKLVRLTVHGDY